MARRGGRKHPAGRQHPRDDDAGAQLVRSYFDGHAPHVSGQVKRVVADAGISLTNEILGRPSVAGYRAVWLVFAAVLVLGFTIGIDKGALERFPTTDRPAGQAQPDTGPSGTFGSPLPERPDGVSDDEVVKATVHRSHGQTGLVLVSAYGDSRGIHVQVMSIAGRLPGYDVLLTANSGEAQHEIPASGQVELPSGLIFSWTSRDTPPIADELVGAREVVFSFRRPDGTETTTSGRFPVDDAMVPMTPSELEELERELIKLSLRKVS